MDDTNRIVRIEDKLDAVKDSLSGINSTLAAQHESLKEHMRRTELLEVAVTPLKNHVDMVNGVLKFLSVIALLSGIAASIVALTK